MQVPVDDLDAAANDIREALVIRQTYANRNGHYFPVTTAKFLDGQYPDHLPSPQHKDNSRKLWVGSAFCVIYANLYIAQNTRIRWTEFTEVS